jgi:hypothetical protein
MCHAVVYLMLFQMGNFFLLCLFLNNHVVLVKELNVLLVQDLHSLAFTIDFPMHFLQNPTHKYP